MGWTLKLKQLDGTVISSDVGFESLQASWVLNSPGSIEINLPWNATTFSDWKPGERELTLSRDGTVVWGGYLWSTEGNARSEDARGRGAGYYSVLRRRVVTTDQIYTAANQHDIAWNLINHTQGQVDGALGLTQGTHTGAFVNRNREYCALERPNVAEGIEELAGLDDGFDFEINPVTKAFKTWTPSRGASSGITFNGFDEVSLDWEEDATEATSYVTGIGSDDCNPYIADLSNASAIAKFNRLHDVVEADTDLGRDVAAQAREYLRERRQAMFRATLAFEDEFGPAWGTYGLGDTVVVSPAKGFANFTKTLRIVEISVSLEEATNAYVELTLDGALEP